LAAAADDLRLRHRHAPSLLVGLAILRAAEKASAELHTATVRLVDKLEGAGLGISEPGADKRAVSLRLTELGRERARNHVHERCVLLGDLVDVLTPSQRERLDEILETLLRSMVKAAEDADHICRLCDGEECPPERCPVHQKALALDVGMVRYPDQV
jgi:MarR family transcriptional regulator, negative regulator of the multidrug operon emrRAB